MKVERLFSGHRRRGMERSGSVFVVKSFTPRSRFLVLLPSRRRCYCTVMYIQGDTCAKLNRWDLLRSRKAERGGLAQHIAPKQQIQHQTMLPQQ